MNKKAGMNTFQVIIVLAVIALVGITWWGVSSNNQQAIEQQNTALTETGVVTSAGKVSCPSDGTTSYQVRYEDTLASTTTYDASPTCYATPKTAGEERVTAGSLSASDYSTAADLKCTESGTKWRAECVSTQDDMHSAIDESDFVAEGSFVKRTLRGKAFDVLKFKIEDKFTGGAKFFNNTLCGTDGIGYTAFNGSQCTIKNDAAITGTSLTLGADEYIDAKIYLKTSNTKRQFGEDGLKTWMLVDADGSSWDEPIVSRDGGAKLSSNVDGMMTEDRRKYSGFEYAYEVGMFDDRESIIDFYLQTASGVNPGASVDPVVEFCSEGRYNSNKQEDSVLVGCWTDAASQAEVTTAKLHKFKFDVS